MFKLFIRTMSTIKASKAALRKEIEEKLLGLSAEEKKRQTDAVLKQLFGLQVFKESKRISLYLSLENEIDTEPIVRHIFESQRSCYVPRYHGKTMEMVKLYSYEDWKNLPVTKWNIKQPPLKEPRENAFEAGLDLIIVPGVAFTKEGHRLGHGMGYYDRFFKNAENALGKVPPTVALALKEQIVDSLPLESTDYIVDMVLYSD